MTLLQVTWSSGKRERCDARCHNSIRQRCSCCCHGRYHGQQEGSAWLVAAVREEQAELLNALGRLEQRGVLWIDCFRPSTEEPLIRRPAGKPRAYQELLFAEAVR